MAKHIANILQRLATIFEQHLQKLSYYDNFWLKKRTESEKSLVVQGPYK